MNRDIDVAAPVSGGEHAEGRRVVAVVGIDRYRAWPTLEHAVSDASGALHVFLRLGFEQVTPPLIDEAATADAIRRLVTDELATLSCDDSLVLFFAGHGHVRTRTLQSGPVQTGYMIPVDGERPEGHSASWLRLDSWLSDVARLPARHILVILDACHSGIALGSLVKWRGDGSLHRRSFDDLRRRQSRRVITSALADQRAMDGGPMGGHSLFTGCLLEGLTGGLTRLGQSEATGTDLGVYVQRRVASYTESRQTPDFGALELDDRGELVLSLAPEDRASRPSSGTALEKDPVDLDHHPDGPARAVGASVRSSQIRPLKRVALLDRRLAAELIVVGRSWTSSHRVEVRSMHALIYALGLYRQVLVEDYFGSALASRVRGDDLLSETISFLPREAGEGAVELSATTKEIGRAWLDDPGFQLAASAYGRSKGNQTENLPDVIAYLQRTLFLARRFDAAVIPHPDRWRLYHHWFEGDDRSSDRGPVRTVVALPEPVRAAEAVSTQRSALIAQLAPRTVNGTQAVYLVRYGPMVYPTPEACPGDTALATHASFIFEFCTVGSTETSP